MNRSTLFALLLFCANTAVGVAIMWVNRPHTVASLGRAQLQPEAWQRLLNVLDEAQVMPSEVRVCSVAPCTDGPAVFVVDGQVRRLVLPQGEALGPLVEVLR